MHRTLLYKKSNIDSDAGEKYHSIHASDFDILSKFSPLTPFYKL